MSNIFISYRSADTKELALRLIEELQLAGFPVWLDKSDIPVDAEWLAAINHAVKSCSAFVLLLSPESANSSFVQREYQHAIEHGKPVAVLLTDNTPVPFYLDCEQHFDFRVPSEKSIPKLTDYLRWATSEEWERLDTALATAMTMRQPEDPTVTTGHFASALHTQLEALGWDIADFARETEIDDDFARAILSDEFPLDELDPVFIEEIAQVLKLDVTQLELMQTSLGLATTIVARVTRVIELFWTFLAVLFQALESQFRTPLLYKRASEACRDYLLAYWKLEHDPPSNSEDKVALVRAYFNLYTHLGIFEQQCSAVPPFRRSRVLSSYSELKLALEDLDTWYNLRWYCLEQPNLVSRQLIDFRETAPTLLFEQLRELWINALNNPALSVNRRRDAGRALGILRLDNRRGVGVIDGIPDLEWCVVRIQSEHHTNVVSSKPTDLTLRFVWMTRYPITYRQFEAFVDDHGYAGKEFWSEEGWHWKGERRHPDYYWSNPDFHIDNQPVVGVSWYEVIAFFQWLSAKLKVSRDRIRLPTKVEWEAAARQSLPDDSMFLNFKTLLPVNFDCLQETVETSRRSPRAVGVSCLRDRESSDAIDIDGNLWEWCLAAHPARAEKADYVLRGLEACSDDCEGSDCTETLPPNRVGFRVCLLEGN